MLRSSDLYDVAVTLSPGSSPLIVRGVTADQVQEIDDAAFETPAEISFHAVDLATSIDHVLACLAEMRTVAPPAVGDPVLIVSGRYRDNSGRVSAVLGADDDRIVVTLTDHVAGYGQTYDVVVTTADIRQI